jgi:hypothetical protein
MPDATTQHDNPLKVFFHCQLTLISASGFIIAWTPFSILCLWEIASPPPEIPSGE